ncbi:MAG: NUDIX hydrolase [bacterium]|nr:NUDIX hydrolase [bacterium]
MNAHILELEQRGDAHTCTSAVIIREGKILLGLRHYTPDTWKAVSVWTTPGGRCEPWESVEEGLRRETKEETDIDDLIIKRFIGKMPAAGDKRDTLWVFLCETPLEARLMEPEKFSDWRWFPLDELPENFINPELMGAILANVAPGRS